MIHIGLCLNFFFFFRQTTGFGATSFGAAATAAQPVANPGLNFSFGAQAAQPTLNTGTTGLFGANANQPQLNQPAQPAQPLQMGLPTQQTTGLTFGTTNTATKPTGLSFGAPATQATTGLSFGTNPTTLSGGLSFGLSSSTTGTTTTGAATNFGALPATGASSFGTTSTATTAPTTSILSFGATATPAISTNFGATPAPTTTCKLLFDDNYFFKLIE